MNDILSYLRELNIVSMNLRIVLAMLAGGLIGLEREKKRRAAGFRTYMFVALGAAITVMLSQYLDLMLGTEWAATAVKLGIKTDVSRFGAQVINGVGFLGAGTIIVTDRQEVKGLTTAAGLWASACMGLAVGAGFYECVLIGFVLILCSIKFLPMVEEMINYNSHYLNIYIEMEGMDDLGGIINYLKGRSIRIFDVDIDKVGRDGVSQVNALISTHLPGRVPHTEVLAGLSTLDGILTIEEV